MADKQLSQVTLLPEQVYRLADIAAQNRGAIGLSQTGSVIHVDTGTVKFDVGPQGNYLTPSNPNQGELPC
jgi:hypothetical protein